MILNTHSKYKNFIVLATIFVLAVFFMNINVFRLTMAHADSKKDSIAIRIIPNSGHESAFDWYKSRGFSGSPQSLIIDDYNAIRDGRTVYVNAANVVSGNLYTNIYLISYNQEAENLTVDIFAKMLKSWIFNANLSVPGICTKKNETVCLTDSDCELGDYCQSAKARVTRDTLRFEDMQTLKQALDNYFLLNNHFPILNAGTYLPQKSLSVWPSWQSVLAQELKLSLPKDPINAMGACGADRFHPVTCWDEAKKEFADPSPGNATFDLPDDSYAYFYKTVLDGSSFNLCSLMESGYGNTTGNICLL